MAYVMGDTHVMQAETELNQTVLVNNKYGLSSVDSKVNLNKPILNNNEILLAIFTSFLFGVSLTFFIFQILNQKNENFEYSVTETKYIKDNPNKNSEKLSSLGQMAGGIAHEINNPLTIILGNAQKVHNIMKNLPMTEENKRVNASMNKILDSGHRISTLVRNFLNFSKEHLGKKSIINVNDLINEASDFLELKAPDEKVFFEVFRNDEDIKVLGNHYELSQVVISMLNNSFEAIKNKKGSWIELSIESLDKEIQIVIKDSGTTPVNLLNGKMFEPFFTTKGIGEGTGMGLSAAKGIIESHGGEIFCSSESAHTTMIIKIPKYSEDLAKVA